MKRTILLILTMIAFYAMGLVESYIHSTLLSIVTGVVLAAIIASYLDKKMK